jgi:hypothetical protein
MHSVPKMWGDLGKVSHMLRSAAEAWVSLQQPEDGIDAKREEVLLEIMGML